MNRIDIHNLKGTDLSWVRGDSLPGFRATLRQDSRDPHTEGAPIDLTGAAVKFVLYTVKGIEVGRYPVEVEEPEEGTIFHQWQPGQTDSFGGRYLARFVATYPSGDRKTVPNFGHIRVFFSK